MFRKRPPLYTCLRSHQIHSCQTAYLSLSICRHIRMETRTLAVHLVPHNSLMPDLRPRQWTRTCTSHSLGRHQVGVMSMIRATTELTQKTASEFHQHPVFQPMTQKAPLKLVCRLFASFMNIKLNGTLHCNFHCLVCLLFFLY